MENLETRVFNCSLPPVLGYGAENSIMRQYNIKNLTTTRRAMNRGILYAMLQMIMREITGQVNQQMTKHNIKIEYKVIGSNEIGCK